MRYIRKIVGGLVVLFSLSLLWVAFGFLRLGVETWFGHPYYLGNHHFAYGGFWLFIGLAALLPGAYSAVSCRASAWWLALAFGATLLGAVALPSNVLPTMLMPRAEDTLTAKAHTLQMLWTPRGQTKVAFRPARRNSRRPLSKWGRTACSDRTIATES